MIGLIEATPARPEATRVPVSFDKTGWWVVCGLGLLLLCP
jgi:hypothetical protein